MIRYGVLTVLCLLQSGEPAEGGPKRALEVTYIANEGFMIAMGGTKILIDALQRSKHYANPSDTLVANMIEGVPPFADIDYVLVTHDHADHFNAEMVSRFLVHHPATQLIASSETCGKLAKEGVADRQRTGIDLEMGHHRTIRSKKAEIVALRLEHAGGGEITNLAFLVRAHGFMIVHVGDALLAQDQDDVRAFDWSSYKVDILFIGYGDTGSLTQQIIRNVIKPKHVVLMHIPPGEEESVRKEPVQVHPRTVVFGKQLETRRFNN
jgi:L-ascorbate metabolism protein UlaG (beta-lactamase superfamily)